jgi:hypothetical protein
LLVIPLAGSLLAATITSEVLRQSAQIDAGAVTRRNNAPNCR